jgi:hypothetical protein
MLLNSWFVANTVEARWCLEIDQKHFGAERVRLRRAWPCGRLRDFGRSKSMTVRGPGLANTVYRSL